MGKKKETLKSSFEGNFFSINIFPGWLRVCALVALFATLSQGRDKL
jgi:hypothetical protein